MANFDSTFDYSKAIEALHKASGEQHVGMKMLKAHSATVPVEFRAHSIKAHAHLESINHEAICVLEEINRLLALPAEDKARLYEYHMTLGCSKIDFMVRVLFNSERILNGPDGKRVIADQSMSAADKSKALRELAKKYPPANDHTIGLNIVRAALKGVLVNEKPKA